MLELLPPNCSFSSGVYADCLTLVAHAQPPRYNLPCGPIPPTGVPDDLAPDLVPARCHEPSIMPLPVPFTNKSVGMLPPTAENPSLFSDPPMLSSRGVLQVKSAPNAHGSAAFALLLESEGFGKAAVSSSRKLGISAVPARVKPTFEPVHVTVNEDSGNHVLKFATDVLSGDPYASQEALLAYKWVRSDIKCECPLNDCSEGTLFTRPPTSANMATYLLNDESAYGALRFQWAPDQHGECRITVAVYDGAAEMWQSEPQTFILRALPVNDPPTVTLARNLTDGWALDQGQGRIEIPIFSCLSWAPDTMPSECGAPVPEWTGVNGTLVTGSQGLCVRGPDSTQLPFGDGCREPIVPNWWQPPPFHPSSSVPVGPFCTNSTGQDIIGTIFSAEQGPCWFSMELRQVMKAAVKGRAGSDQTVGELIQAPSAVRYIGLDFNRITLEMDSVAFGLYRLTLAFRDRGGTAGGGSDTTLKHLWVEVKQTVLPPEISFPQDDAYVDVSVLAPSSRAEEETYLDLSDSSDTTSTPYQWQITLGIDPADIEAQIAREMAHTDLLQELDDLALTNVSALNLFVVEMKQLQHQYYPDLLQDITNGPPDQASVNDLTATIVELSSSHLFQGGSHALSDAFSVGVSSGAACAGCPVLGMDGRVGSLSFTLAPFRYGIASMKIRLESVSRADNTTKPAISTYRFDVIVLGVNDPPSADVTRFLGLPEGLDAVVIPFFATNITVGPENEVWQQPVFHVYSQADTAHLVTALPQIDAHGTLSLGVEPSLHGRIRLRIMLSDTGGTANGGRNTSSLGFPVEAEIKVFPRPKIVSVSPCVGVAGGGWFITIRGMYFGSAYSNDAHADSMQQGPEAHPSAQALQVHVGGQPCSSSVMVSDTVVVCQVPGGGMRRQVQVTVGGGKSVNQEGRVLSDWSGRRATYAAGVVHAHIYFGGAAGTSAGPAAASPWAGPSDVNGDSTRRAHLNSTESSTRAGATNEGNQTEPRREGIWLDGGGEGGMLAVSPAMDCPNAQEMTSSVLTAQKECPQAMWDGDARSVPPTTASMPHLSSHLSRSVRAMTAFRARVVVGGSFLGHTSNRLDYVLQWDGSKVESVGGGLDGTVYALVNFRESLVVAGSFSQLYQSAEAGGLSVVSGGLGLWDGHRWDLVGGSAVRGTVTCLATAGSNEPGGDSHGHHLLYVAGRFRYVGDVAALNIAVFNQTSQRWQALGAGLRARDIYALAVALPANASANVSGAAGGASGTDEMHSVFAVGSISHAGELLLGNVARWRAQFQTWHPMKNVNGIVRAAAVMDSRLFIGGDFTVAGGQPVAAIAYTDIDDANAADDARVRWREVGVGVQGNVHVLLAVEGCLYVGGRIDSVGDHQGVKPANNVARWCVPRPESPLQQERWEPVQGLDRSGGTVMAMAIADVSLGPDLSDHVASHQPLANTSNFTSAPSAP